MEGQRGRSARNSALRDGSNIRPLTTAPVPSPPSPPRRHAS
jgi:hypothetical protein